VSGKGTGDPFFGLEGLCKTSQWVGAGRLSRRKNVTERKRLSERERVRGELEVGASGYVVWWPNRRRLSRMGRNMFRRSTDVKGKDVSEISEKIARF
jgi:hypothetical protein